MQPTRSIFKIPVLITFVFLIGGFVAYRAGALDELFSRKKELINPAAPEAKEMNLIKISNTPLPDTLFTTLPDPEFIILSSSKSMQILDYKSIYFIEPSYKGPDSLLRLIFRNSDSPLKQKFIISSSKSGRIIEQKPVWPYKIDTSKKR